jgi:pimeloyl-ACP methyl ester carboxylesterase
MAEQRTRANGIEIAYETFGDEGDPALLLIMGLGVQMVGWDEGFCEMLAERGFHVVRFDNRDVGHSTWIDGGPTPDVMAAVAGDVSSASYLLDDMAADTAGLLDALGVRAAHVVGASQGGMIAQALAIGHPERVLSLTLIMSTTGNREVGAPHPEAIPALLTRPPDDREGYAEAAVRSFRVIGSPGYPNQDERIRDRALRSHDRGYNPAGTARQLVAILASGDRTEALAGVSAPTLVIHGEQDALIDVSGGRALAEAIPGAELRLVPGMGHDMPRELWPELVDWIAANAARSDATASPSAGPA